jgi:hypothetical protein
VDEAVHGDGPVQIGAAVPAGEDGNAARGLQPVAGEPGSGDVQRAYGLTAPSGDAPIADRDVIWTTVPVCGA